MSVTFSAGIPDKIAYKFLMWDEIDWKWKTPYRQVHVDGPVLESVGRAKFSRVYPSPTYVDSFALHMNGYLPGALVSLPRNYFTALSGGAIHCYRDIGAGYRHFGPFRPAERDPMVLLGGRACPLYAWEVEISGIVAWNKSEVACKRVEFAKVPSNYYMDAGKLIPKAKARRLADKSQPITC